MIEIAIPGRPAMRLATALVDFNGTLALDGVLIDGVADRLVIDTLRADETVVIGNGCNDAHGK